MSKRIIQIVQKMSPGGLEVLALRIAAALDGQHTILSLEGDTQSLRRSWSRLSEAPLNFIALGKNPGFDTSALWRLYQAIVQLRPHVVLTHHAGPLIYGGLAARAAGRYLHIHIEHDVWHLQSPRRASIMKAMGRILKPKVIGVSEKMRTTLERTYAHCDVSIISNGVELPARPSLRRIHARASLGLSANAKVIGAAGRLAHVKGHDVLIDAMTRLPDDVLLILAGDGSNRCQLEEQSARLGLDGRVRFLGHRDDLDAIYPAFDVFCQPSRNEGLPLAILEAQASGVHVVASAVGDMGAGVCPRSGELVPPEDVRALADALLRALSRIPPSPREFIAARFDFHKTVEGYAKIIEGY